MFSSAAFAAPAHPVKASLISELKGFQPGQVITVGLLLKTDAGWHTYWKDPGDAGLPTTIELTLPNGFEHSGILWPKAKKFIEPGGLVGYGYAGATLLPIEIRTPKSYTGTNFAVEASADWLVCREVCIPGSAKLALTIPLGTGPSEHARKFEAVRPGIGSDPDGYVKSAVESSAPSAPARSLALMLLFAFLGGLILNLMPCVLPVLSLKVMAFVRQSGESRGRSIALGSAFSAGAIASFWALAALVVAARAAGESVGWGFQFQSPAFVAVMAVIVTAFALNLFGVFELYLPGKANQAFHEAGGKEGLSGAFFTGAFMTLLATPCTAPFLGTALGFAFSQSSGTLFLIFSAVGLGLAAPYQILSSFPRLMAWVPKPGKWMLHFKQFMGFPLLFTVAWLLWVLGKQTGVEFVVWMLAYLMLVALAAWVYGAFAPVGSPWSRLISVALLNLMLLALGWQNLLREPFKHAMGPVSSISSDGWEPYSESRIAELTKSGKSVFVDFTAEWCWTCKVNERVVLGDSAVEAAFIKSGVVKMKADWTRKDPAITAALKRFERSGVPYYVLYSPKFQKPMALGEVITPSGIVEALNKI